MEADDTIALALTLNERLFDPEVLLSLGQRLAQRGLYGLAAVCAESAMATEGHVSAAMAISNLAAYHKALGRRDTAAELWHRALDFAEGSKARAALLSNLAGLYVGNDTPDMAAELAEEALSEDSACSGAALNLGLARLEQADWRGWSDWSRASLSLGERLPPRDYGCPAWGGQGRVERLVVWGDQGLGDEIFYAGCLPEVLGYADELAFECHPRLEGLFRASFPEIEIYGTRKSPVADWLDAFQPTAQIGLADLPQYLRRADQDWIGHAPSLVARPRDERRSGAARIGLCWRGGTAQTGLMDRSVPLQCFAPLLYATTRAEFYSLQYGETASFEACRLSECGRHVAHLPSVIDDPNYVRTAELVASLDLVITVTTSVHHLAGALGVPCWTLVPYRTTWQYQRKTATLPWYPDAKLYRQQSDGDWSEPIRQVAADLASFCEERVNG